MKRCSRAPNAPDVMSDDINLVTVRNRDLDVEAGNQANWNRPDRRRWGFHNLHRLARYGLSLRAENVLPLTKVIDRRIGDMPLVRQLTGSTMFSAMAVVRDQDVLFEKYAPDFGPDCPHSIQSISKTTMHLVCGKLVEDGLLDLDAKVSAYLPEVASGYAEATVQQVLDMNVINNFNEDYADPWQFVDMPGVTVGYGREEIAMSWRLQPPGEAVFGCRAFAAALVSDDVENTTGMTQYKSPNTDIAGWIAERVSGRSLREHLIDIVEAAGIEGTFHISTDCDGVPVIAGGVSLTARDLARYGGLIARGGRGVNGTMVGSPAFLERTRVERGQPRYEDRDDLTYHNQLMTNGRWVSHGGYGGQYLLVDPDSRTVMVFFSVLEDEQGYDASYYPDIIAMAEQITQLS